MVTVEKYDDVGLLGLRTAEGVGHAGQAGVAVARARLAQHGGTVGAGNFAGVVGRIVVDHDDLPGQARGNFGQHQGNGPGFVVGRNDNADAGLRHESK